MKFWLTFKNNNTPLTSSILVKKNAQNDMSKQTQRNKRAEKTFQGAQIQITEVIKGEKDEIIQ